MVYLGQYLIYVLKLGVYLAFYVNLLTHYAKGTFFLFLIYIRTAYKTTISNISLTLLIRYRSCILFSFRERYPYIQTWFYRFTLKAFINLYWKSHLIYFPEVNKIFQFTSSFFLISLEPQINYQFFHCS